VYRQKKTNVVDKMFTNKYMNQSNKKTTNDHQMQNKQKQEWQQQMNTIPPSMGKTILMHTIKTK